MRIKLTYSSNNTDARFHLCDPIIASDMKLFRAPSDRKIYNGNATDVIYVCYPLERAQNVRSDIRLNETLG